MSLSFVRRVAIVALTLPLLLTGCSEDDPVPKMPDASSPSPTDETEPTNVVEPTLPPEAASEGATKAEGIAGAEAFVRHYYAMANYAQATGDTKALRALGSDFCDACNAGADALQSIYRQGGSIEGGENTVEKATVTGVQRGGEADSIYSLTVKISNTAQSVTGAGELDGDYPADTSLLRFQVSGSDSGYRVLQWGTK